MEQLALATLLMHTCTGAVVHVRQSLQSLLQCRGDSQTLALTCCLSQDSSKGPQDQKTVSGSSERGALGPPLLVTSAACGPAFLRGGSPYVRQQDWVRCQRAMWNHTPTLQRTESHAHGSMLVATHEKHTRKAFVMTRAETLLIPHL